MEILHPPYVVVVHTYSEFPQLRPTDLDTPFSLDPAAVLTAEAARLLHNNYPTWFDQFVLSTKIPINKRGSSSRLIARAMARLIEDTADSSIVDIDTYVHPYGTSTTDEIRAARRIAFTSPLLSICMRYHEPRVRYSLTRELGRDMPVLTTEDILESLAPDFLETYNEWLAGPEHQSRIRREKLAYKIDSTPVGHFAIETLNSLTGGRGINQVLLRLPRS